MPRAARDGTARSTLPAVRRVGKEGIERKETNGRKEGRLE